jgi:hypothetical protein
MMVNLPEHFEDELTRQQLSDWHFMICNGRRNRDVIGGYCAS